MLEIAGDQGLLTASEVAAAQAEPVSDPAAPVPDAGGARRRGSGRGRLGRPGVIRLAIDARLQERLEALAAERAAVSGPELSAAILVLNNRDGRVLAQVGSAGYLDAGRRGAIDMTLRGAFPRIGAQAVRLRDGLPGQGLAHPETLLEDRPARFSASYAPENFDLSFQGTVTARRALQLSLNIPAVELMEAVGPARFIARLRAAGAGIQLPREAAPGLPVALGGLGITLTDLARLYAGLARGGAVPDLVRRAGVAATASDRRVAEPVAAWYVADILRGTPPPENALPKPHRLQDRHLVRLSRRLGGGLRPARDGGGLGRAAGRPAVPGLVGRTVAAPILFDAFARLGTDPEPVPQPRDVLAAGPGGLPPPLRRLRQDAPRTFAASESAPLKIAFPPDGSLIDLGLKDGERDQPLALKALGGAPPFTWFVNGAP